MANDPLKGEIRKKELKWNIIWSVVISAYTGAYIGAERVFYESLGDDLINNLTNVISDIYELRSITLPVLKIEASLPGALCIFPTDPGLFLAGLITGVIIGLNQYMDFVTKQKERRGEEYGSGSFNTDYGRLLKNYVMSPEILKEAYSKGHISVSFFEYACLKIKKKFSNWGNREKHEGLRRISR